MLKYSLLSLSLGLAAAQSVDQRLIGYYIDQDTTVTATCHSTPDYTVSWITVASETGACGRVDPDGSTASFWGLKCTETSGTPAYLYTGVVRSGGTIADAFSAIQLCGTRSVRGSASGCGTLTVVDAAPDTTPNVFEAINSAVYVTCLDNFPADAELTLFRSPPETAAGPTETSVSSSGDESNSGQGSSDQNDQGSPDQNSDGDQGSPASSNAGLIAGAVVGSVAGVGLIVGAFLLGRRMALRKGTPPVKEEDGGGSSGLSELGDGGLRVEMPDSGMPAELSGHPPFMNELEAGDVSVQAQQPGGVSPATIHSDTTPQGVSPTTPEGQTQPSPGPSSSGVAAAVAPDDGELAEWQSHREAGVGHHGR
ncbi:uncharacterized protein DNG_07070 [Cephalotrichum gorgonifer]|uniref:Uncharacterized protein n=1 Tax=Cephalotrichum gorgonifer TaxID=2041049 RepID=A0AAE8N107_9PEZI|nr:uncharacterized protein DNG_07070 [Cephalotrichum gorgonifer]